MYDRYLAGWGYLLSQDAVQLIVSTVDEYQQQPEQAPGWFAGLHWEDVLVGLLLHDYAHPQNRPNGTACYPFDKGLTHNTCSNASMIRTCHVLWVIRCLQLAHAVYSIQTADSVVAAGGFVHRATDMRG